jgi:tryptophanyl-tRNA synthetase
MSTRILTGLQANSTLHIGNYFGGILPMIEIQKAMSGGDQIFMFVPNLHSFTLPIDHSILYQQTLENVRYYLAAGLETAKHNVFIYRQSAIPAHSELAWILSCFTYMGELSRMTQYKDKSAKTENIGVGLFTYPILMAADILLYNAEYVPVGDDQKQHLELARDIAIRMNNRFEKERPGGLFVVPKSWKEQLEFRGQQEGVRIRSLSNPEKKMSKSVLDPKGTILLTDTPQIAAKKIMSATTDNEANILWNWENQPGITNLLQLYSILSKKTIEETKGTWQGQSMYGPLKKEVAGLVEIFLENLHFQLNQVSDKQVRETLINGEKQASIWANETMRNVKYCLGLLQ